MEINLQDDKGSTFRLAEYADLIQNISTVESGFDLNAEFTGFKWTNGYTVKNAPVDFDAYAIYFQLSPDSYNKFEFGWGSNNKFAYRTWSGNPSHWCDWKVINN